MSNRIPASTSGDEDSTAYANSKFKPGAPLSECDPELLRRQAELVANGELPIPQGLSASQLEALVEHVRRSRRQRLLNHVARAIALDIKRTRASERKDGEGHVEASF